jgi:hypothetical protein
MNIELTTAEHDPAHGGLAGHLGQLVGRGVQADRTVSPATWGRSTGSGAARPQLGGQVLAVQCRPVKPGRRRATRRPRRERVQGSQNSTV